MRPTARERANRQNAKRSTGPRTKEGKSRVAQNALSHGLSIPIESNTSQSPQIHALARLMAPEEGDEVFYAVAYRVAEAQFDLKRIRDARLKLLSDPQTHRIKVCRRVNIKLLKALCRLQGKTFEEELEKIYNPGSINDDTPLENMIGDVAPELMRLDRYERRAFSRLKKAMREFENLMLMRQDNCAA